MLVSGQFHVHDSGVHRVHQIQSGIRSSGCCLTFGSLVECTNGRQEWVHSETHWRRPVLSQSKQDDGLAPRRRPMVDVPSLSIRDRSSWSLYANLIGSVLHHSSGHGCALDSRQVSTELELGRWDESQELVSSHCHSVFGVNQRLRIRQPPKRHRRRPPDR